MSFRKTPGPYFNKQSPAFAKLISKNSDGVISSPEIGMSPVERKKTNEVSRSRNKFLISVQKVTVGDIDDVPDEQSS